MSVEVHAKHAGALLIQHIDAESTVEQLQIALARDFGLDATSVKLCVNSSSSRGVVDCSRICIGLFHAPFPKRPLLIFRELLAP